MIRHGADEVFAGQDSMYTEEDFETLLAKGAKKVGGADLEAGLIHVCTCCVLRAYVRMYYWYLQCCGTLQYAVPVLIPPPPLPLPLPLCCRMQS